MQIQIKIFALVNNNQCFRGLYVEVVFSPEFLHLLDTGTVALQLKIHFQHWL